MKKGGADVVKMAKKSEEAAFLLVVPHLHVYTVHVYTCKTRYPNVQT